ncbi:MAG: DnaJ domain-containing protein [Clostridia bacterium]|nr:DnaJ domain-containing protein [Clostridia bacterium]
MVKNPYEILGIAEGASMEEIKRAYRKKAKAYHPDLHPDDPTANERMQEVNQAYDMLCNPDKYAARRQAEPNPRYAYTRTGAGPQYGQGSRPYTYYAYAGEENPWSAWQDTGSQRQQQSAGIVRPFRGFLRVIGGILLFRFIVTLLRFGLFGFFF